jgi:hypothetical protein
MRGEYGQMHRHLDYIKRVLPTKGSGAYAELFAHRVISAGGERAVRAPGEGEERRMA